MTEPATQTETVDAYPAKRFFVEMLTRDIELQDAILDMLDNCVDGALRQNALNPPANPTRPYEGRQASITFDKSEFSITDNCGGIPIGLAKNYAFRMGRQDQERDADIPTVGMYGIGMKRAIFKIGRYSKVISQHEGNGFEVEILPEWLESDAEWTLPIKTDNINLRENGTTILISSLNEQISHQFSSEITGFEDTFRKAITAHYSYIIEKGFKVIVNGEEILPKTVGLLFDPDSVKSEGIAPYLYQGEIDGVTVNLAIGMYRDIPTEDESDLEIQGRNTKENAGWTVICNDRVVVYCDKTRLTGWGEAGVPNYHSQFIAISGIVVFKSNDAKKLPVTTTKRGIDGNSETYLIVKDIMRDGLKHFTSFTNKWKANTPERHQIQSKSKPIEILKASMEIPDAAWTQVKKEIGGRKFIPNLPMPRTENPNSQVRFYKPVKEIKIVAEYLFDDSTKSASDVGNGCFEYVLKKATS